MDLLPETTTVDTTVVVVVMTEADTVAETATGTVDPPLPVETMAEGTTTESVTVTTVTVLLVGTGTGRPLLDPGITTDEALLLLPGRGTSPLPGVVMIASKCEQLLDPTWNLVAYSVAILDRLGSLLVPCEKFLIIRCVHPFAFRHDPPFFLCSYR